MRDFSSGSERCTTWPWPTATGSAWPAATMTSAELGLIFMARANSFIAAASL